MIPTTTVTILDDAPTEDAFGDLVDTYSAVALDVPAHIYEARTRTFEGGRPTLVTQLKAILPGDTKIRAGMRLRDGNTIYQVTNIITFSSFAHRPHMEVELELID